MPEIVCEFVDEPDAQLTNLGSKGLGEPPIVPTAAAIANAIRDATGADVTSLPITREEILRALREAEAAKRKEPRCSWCGLARSRRRSPRSATAASRSPAGRSSCRCCATGSSRPTGSSTSRDVVPRGISGGTIGAGATLAELEADPADPGRAARGVPARRLAAAPQHGHDRRQPAPGDALLVLAARLPLLPARRRPLPSPARASTASTPSSATSLCASAHPSDPAAALLALGARIRTDRRELDLAELYRLPTEDDRSTTTLEPGELILELELPEAESSVYLKAMDRKRWAFALVGVAAARVGGETRIALAGAAPVPWLLESSEALEQATPLPGTAYKVEVARTLVARALEQPLMRRLLLARCCSSSSVAGVRR